MILSIDSSSIDSNTSKHMGGQNGVLQIALEGIEPIQSLVAEVAEDGLLGVHLGHHHASVVIITLNNIWGSCMESRIMFLCMLKQYEFYMLRYKRMVLLMFTWESQIEV